MSWQEVTPVVGSVVQLAKGLVRYSVTKRLGIKVLVPSSVAAECGWKPGEKLKLFVGGGDHTGQLRLVADRAGLLSLRNHNRGDTVLYINLGRRIPQLPDREVERVVVPHVVAANALEISLPVHAQAIVPAPRPTIAPPPGTKIDVTEKIAGGGPKPPKFAAVAGVRR